MQKTEQGEYLEFVRDVLNAVKNNQIEETDYELHHGEIEGYQVNLIYDKSAETYKGFLLIYDANRPDAR